jgi:hypothetical protein
MVAFLHKLVVLLVPEGTSGGKRFVRGSNKHPSPCKKRGKIKLEVYGEEIVVDGLRMVLMPDRVQGVRK